MYISIILKWNMKIMTVFYIFFYLWCKFFRFFKSATYEKIFQEHETNVDFYSLFVAFDNFYQIISLKFFYFRSLLEEYQLRYSKVDEPGVKKFSYPGIVFKLVKFFFTFKMIFTFSRYFRLTLSFFRPKPKSEVKVKIFKT